MTQRSPADQYKFKNQDSQPDAPVNVLRNFLKAWDDSADEKETYLNYIQPDAVLLFGGPHTGRKEWKAARDGLIHQHNGPILRSQHFLETVFVYDMQPETGRAWEIVGTADVRYDIVDGNEVWTRAATWCRIVEAGEERLIERYEVFMDGTKLFEALGKLNKS
ncbi:uncharacterized protein AB675_9459 [Cyphellophora attinorum]|uniref:SnoaL-like domain-containing protein n=1 Tax=Cyphellophora attinorum TaxID=1664694 RepID=A0A0N0NP61_9EURO|nr:uncharacterized protein AB675_9459 [Phialophora attinorum]KPI42348.1 hypothetical protein AB675_9459 [Phialophora attinorum]